MDAEIICAKGLGAKITINKEQRAESREQKAKNREQRTENREQLAESYYFKFLENYKNDIAALPEVENKSNYVKKLNEKERQVFTTLLPFMAAVRKHEPELTLKEMIKELKRYCIAGIERVLAG